MREFGFATKQEAVNAEIGRRSEEQKKYEERLAANRCRSRHFASAEGVFRTGTDSPGKQGLVNAQIDRTPQDGIGRHAISFGEDEDVATGNLAAGHATANARMVALRITERSTLWRFAPEREQRQ